MVEKYHIKQEPGQSINDSFAYFQFILDQIDLSDLTWDTPLDAIKYATHRDQFRLYQFLRALLDNYEPIVANCSTSFLPFLTQLLMS
jgi:hypothetical protein